MPYKITQNVRLEYGRASALPHHEPTSVVEIVETYEHVVKYAITGSGFQTRDPLTNQPPTKDRQEFGERCYVTFGDYTIEEL